MTHEPDSALWPPEDYKLWIRLGNTGLTARLLPKKGGEQLQIADLKWNKNRAETLRRIEDAVYEEHLPIDIYDTEILTEPDRILIAPTETLYDDEVPEDMYELMYPAGDGKSDDVICDHCDDVTFIYGLPRGLKGFLERTFGTARISSILAQRYLELQNNAEIKTGQHTYVYLRPSRMEVIAFSGGQLQFANSFAYTEPADAAYYILNAWQTAALSQLQGHLHLHHEPDTDPDALRQILAKYINHIH